VIGKEWAGHCTSISTDRLNCQENVYEISLCFYYRW